MRSQKNEMKPTEKRLDLQGIRALAIIVVLGFHFYPQYMPNGYLGVDQFFVLSGFLMCMLLKRAEQKTPFSLVSLFYSRRFKRILPLYLLLILLSMLALYNYFPDTAIETNKQSAEHALIFMSNRPKSDQEDYFQMLDVAVDIFTHTWSLSVEIQFYFLVPFIFLLGKSLSSKVQYLYYAILGILSYLLYFFLPPSDAFNSVFARVWQFTIGMIVYILTLAKNDTSYERLTDEEEGKNLLCEEDEVKIQPKTTYSFSPENFYNIFSYFLLCCLLSVIMFPLPLLNTVVRPLVTVGTGILMLISNENMLLSNRCLTYIGDISYSLYLIHWPIYAHWKLSGDDNQLKLIGALAFSVFLAAVTFETFEKWYLKLSSTNIGLLVVLLYFSNVIMINKDEIIEKYEQIGRNSSSRYDNITDYMTLDDAEKFNYRWSVNDVKNLIYPTCSASFPKPPFGWCRHTGLAEDGKYKLLMIGNSWTPMHSMLIHQECGYKAKSILQGSSGACEPLYPTVYRNSDTCTRNFTHFREAVINEKPDYAFIFTRFFNVGDPFEKNNTSISEDPIYKIMLKQTMQMVENIKKKLFILDAIPRVVSRSVSQIVPMLRNGTNPEEIDRILVDTKLYMNARERHAQLIKDCKGKCDLIDYFPEFWNKTTKTFRYYDDRGFSYFTSVDHLNPHGMEHIRHYWKDFCAKL